MIRGTTGDRKREGGVKFRVNSGTNISWPKVTFFKRRRMRNRYRETNSSLKSSSAARKLLLLLGDGNNIMVTDDRELARISIVFGKGVSGARKKTPGLPATLKSCRRL